MKIVLSALIAYLLGSFCASIPLSRRFFGDDVRGHGSGNAGATNMARVYGMKAGLITLGADALKTVAAMLIGKYLAGLDGMAIAGAFCLIGHCFPVYFGFRGGKGVSVGAALGAMDGLAVLAILLAVFFAVAFGGKKVSLASISAAASLPLAAYFLNVPRQLLIMNIFAALLVIIMHHQNIRRLLRGEEGDFKAKN